MECGKPMKIKYIDETQVSVEEKKEENPIQTFAKDMDIPFNIID